MEPPPASEPPGQPPRPVTAETLADALPPRAAQANVDLPTATVGSRYQAEMPTFVDPGGKGLRLTATGLPDGLTFSDLGGGKGAIEGVPQQATSASIRIVATNHHDRTAQMSATLVVGDKPAPATPVAKLESPIPRPRRSHLPSRSRPNPQPAAVPGAQVSAPPPSPPTVQAATPAPSDQNAAPAAPLPPPRSRRSRAWNTPAAQPTSLRRARIFLRLSRPPRRRKRPRRSSRASTAASASSSSRFLEQPNRTSTRRSVGRSNRSAASIQPTSAKSASRQTLQSRQSPPSNVPLSISSASPRRTGDSDLGWR